MAETTECGRFSRQQVKQDAFPGICAENRKFIPDAPARRDIIPYTLPPAAVSYHRNRMAGKNQRLDLA
ncbi:hypothetical protein D2T31_09940 [Sinirhodobacter populi]|uniref:Uncharacterized protein n=1 Tax=Paenirhodobacter populi TaxID=2306993 RepID=A0A443KAC0_9RHOB|nr:hypothetical protein [Sinirhodobacter populi]RWR29749.1 hypothetical protein D2T31_09940 [Sinirhodobacter populi]